METFEISEPYLDLNCGLSEGPFWERDANVLRFVDIANKCVYRVSLDKGPSSLQKIQYAESISVTAEFEGSKDDFLFGGKYGVGIASKDGSESRIIQKYWNDEEIKDGKPGRMRGNDGAVDSGGRFWIATMSDPEDVSSFKPEGAVFRLDPDGQFHRMIDGSTVANGMSWSADNKIMYYTETADKAIYKYDYDIETGSISNRELFFNTEEEKTGADGHAQDEHGNLWAALFGLWKVVRISPEGRITAEVKLPTRCPTAVAFAGEYIYITSSAEHEPKKHPDSVKYAGSVFKCHVGVRGKPSVAARIKQ